MLLLRGPLTRAEHLPGELFDIYSNETKSSLNLLVLFNFSDVEISNFPNLNN